MINREIGPTPEDMGVEAPGKYPPLEKLEDKKHFETKGTTPEFRDIVKEIGPKEGESERIVNNNSHPELEKGEVYLTNVTAKDFHRIGHRTKRMGRVAYDRKGYPIKEIEGLYPVFVQRSELEGKGIDISKYRGISE